ncbi:glucan endo-1,3-beta-glucosidase 8-like isoform X2 [Henckelia pumila]|uniref:glucan endo-1,3-beta-glucosidase 8-like isoform X2 n=1 Tax=Henckelia pumila TaxID=405737 RepID=UPI003C6DD0F3
MIPSMVVDLLLQNDIKEVRLFNPTGNVLEAFTGTRDLITISITIPNDYFFQFNSQDEVLEWVDNWITTFKQRVNFRTYEHTLEKLDLLQSTLNARGYGNEIKATTSHYTDLLNIHRNKSVNPSEAEFLPEFRDRMTEYLRILRKNQAPAMLNVIPMQYIIEHNLDVSFAFMDGKSSYKVIDNNGLVYDNAFEFLYDSFLWAMIKTGHGDVKLVVSQIGWPTDALEIATVANAERFHKHFLPHIAGNRGTPLRPGTNIDVFLQNLSDENKLSLNWGEYQRHWGIYQFNGEPKYKIDFTGQGHETLPSVARGITLMPKRWCVFNGDNTRDNKTLSREIDKCCSFADCSSLEEGGSCSHLVYEKKVSYAFNRYFQTMVHNQSEVCGMNGFGKIVDTDPSDGNCTFPIEILAAEYKQRQDEFLGEKSTSDNPEESSPGSSSVASVPENIILRNMVLRFTIYIFLSLMIL